MTYPIEVLSVDEARALLRACSRRAPTGVRNRALLALLYRAGLRISEALALEPKDLDAAAGTVTVLHGKGDKRRVVGLDPGAFGILDRWLDRREKLGLTRAPIFCTLRGGRVRDNYVRAMVKRMAKRAGIAKRAHPHGLRHTHATELARERVPINVIADQLGHASLATTDRYLRHIAPVEVVAAMQGRTWTP